MPELLEALMLKLIHAFEVLKYPFSYPYQSCNWKTSH